MIYILIFSFIFGIVSQFMKNFKTKIDMYKLGETRLVETNDVDYENS